MLQGFRSFIFHMPKTIVFSIANEQRTQKKRRKIGIFATFFYATL